MTRTPSPRRHSSIVLRLIAAAVLGVALTFTTSWGIALCSSYSQSATRARNENARSRTVFVELLDPRQTDHVTWSESGPGLHRTLILDIRRRAFKARLRDEAGWPMPAMAYEANYRHAHVNAFEWGWRTPLDSTRAAMTPGVTGYPVNEHLAALPLSPVWPGFAVNAAAYTAAVRLIMFATGAIRHARRRRRGRCEACAYDRRGLPSPATPCPECGREAAA